MDPRKMLKTGFSSVYSDADGAASAPARMLGLSAGARQAGAVRRAARRAEAGGIARSSSVLLRCPLSRRFRPLYPQQQTFWTGLGMSQVDPKRTKLKWVLRYIVPSQTVQGSTSTIGGDVFLTASAVQYV